MKRLHFFIKTTRSRLILQSTGAHTAERIILLFKADHFLGLDQFLDWNMYIQLHILMSSKVMFILNIIIVSLKSSKGFGSGKKRELDICTKILCKPLFQKWMNFSKAFLQDWLLYFLMTFMNFMFFPFYCLHLRPSCYAEKRSNKI